MKRIWQFALILLSINMVPSAKALQAGTPEEALEEMATANDIETVIKHLPVKVQEFMEKLPLPQRAAMAEKMLVKRNLEREGGELAKSSDGRTWELVEKEGRHKATIRWKKTFVSGNDALVQVEIKEEHHTGLMMVGMSYEDNEWRVMEVGEWRGTDVESELLPKTASGATGSGDAAVSVLRTLNTALVTYAVSYPAQGYASTLRNLSGEGDQEPSPEHAMLIDNAFLQEPAIKNGYEFRYVRSGPEHYQITATPVQPGEGVASFFTDESCVIRSTSEGRPANANDPPLE
jgi:hypothetical protein